MPRSWGTGTPPAPAEDALHQTEAAVIKKRLSSASGGLCQDRWALLGTAVGNSTQGRGQDPAGLWAPSWPTPHPGATRGHTPSPCLWGTGALSWGREEMEKARTPPHLCHPNMQGCSTSVSKTKTGFLLAFKLGF